MTNSWRFSSLIDRHRALGSNLEDWSGMGTAWSYSKGDPNAEYMAIRTKAGLMDVSGLKKVHITGHAASHVIDRATTRDPEKIAPATSHATTAGTWIAFPLALSQKAMSKKMTASSGATIQSEKSCSSSEKTDFGASKALGGMGRNHTGFRADPSGIAS